MRNNSSFIRAAFAGVIVLAVSVFFVVSAVFFTACGTSEELPDPPSADSRVSADIFIFMGQSNMAGRGESEDAIPCGDGHAYEYRAVSGSDEEGWLYPLAEPFGRYENNSVMQDGTNNDGKKTGGLVSSFCESYHEETGNVVIGVSASVGGTSIKEWAPGTDYYEESERRLSECIEYIGDGGEYAVGSINMVWCQGESDGEAVGSGTMTDYAERLTKIFEGISASSGAEHCFIIPPSEYTNGQIVEGKRKVAEEQIGLCGNSDDFVLASLKFRNVPEELRDDPHFHQGVYNVVGWDAGKNVSKFLENGTESVCEEFVPGEEKTLAARFGIDLRYESSGDSEEEIVMDGEVRYIDKGGAVNLSQEVGTGAAWTSSDEGVASVSGGMVTGIDYGISEITASENGKKTIFTIAVADEDCRIVYGDGGTLDEEGARDAETYTDNPGKFYTLDDNDNAVCTIDGGKITLTRDEDGGVSEEIQIRYIPSDNGAPWRGRHVAIMTISNESANRLTFRGNVSRKTDVVYGKMTLEKGKSATVCFEVAEIPDTEWMNLKFGSFGRGTVTVSDIYLIPVS